MPGPLGAQRRGQRRVVVFGAEPWAPIDSMTTGLKEMGLVGPDLAVEHIWFRGDRARLASAADELVRSRPDVIVTVGTPPVLAIKERTTDIPVVMGLIGDPVGSGIVPSLSRPGGNITGVSVLAAELEPKRLELLGELVPNLKRVHVLANAANAYGKTAIRHAREGAERRGLVFEVAEITGTNDTSDVLQRIVAAAPQAVLVIADQVLLAQRARIAEVFLRARLPSAYTYREHVEAGGLVCYATNYNESFKRAARYVSRILAGAKPGELPVEQVDRFELVLNGGTAKQLGIVVPPTVQQRIDELI